MSKSKSLTLPKLTEKAQKVFNAAIRKRDMDAGCISCPNGKVENAGHYFAAGKYNALRFNEMNVNGQCVQCNKYNHGNLIHYRIGLVKKYGADKVEMLEGLAKRQVHKWNRLELEQIIEIYKQKLK